MTVEQGVDGLRGGTEADQLIREIEEALANTRRFLDELDGSGTAAHEQIGRFAEDLELKIARLRKES